MVKVSVSTVLHKKNHGHFEHCMHHAKHLAEEPDRSQQVFALKKADLHLFFLSQSAARPTVSTLPSFFQYPLFLILTFGLPGHKAGYKGGHGRVDYRTYLTDHLAVEPASHQQVFAHTHGADLHPT